MPVRAAGRKNPRPRARRGQARRGARRAIISWDNHSELTSLVTGADGHFTTQDLEEGNYVFGIKADGYKSGQCTTTIVRPAAPNSATRTGKPAPTAAAGTPAGRWWCAPVQLDCPLVALHRRVGQIVGKVRDADTQAPIPNATIKLVDVAKKEIDGTADQNGAFRFADVMPGARRRTPSTPEGLTSRSPTSST